MDKILLEKYLRPLLFEEKYSIGRIINNAIHISKAPINAAGASLFSNSHLTIAMEAVILTPDTIIVAPVSPRDLARASTLPENIPGITSGKTIFLNVVKELAPREFETISKEFFKSIKDATRVFTIYGKVNETCTNNIRKGIFINGTSVSILIFIPSIDIILSLAVHVINVAKPKPDVGITSGSVIRSSINSLPKNLFLANMYAKGIPNKRSIMTVEKAILNENKIYLCI